MTPFVTLVLIGFVARFGYSMAQRGRAEKLGWFAAAGDLGGTLGPLVGGLLLFYTASYDATFWTVGALGLLPVLMVLRLPRDHRPEDARVSLAERSHQFWSGIREVIGSRAIVIASTLEAALYVGYGVFLGFFPPYARAIGLNDAQIGLVMGGQLATTMLAKPLSGRLSDRLGRKPMILVGLPDHGWLPDRVALLRAGVRPDRDIHGGDRGPIPGGSAGPYTEAEGQAVMTMPSEAPARVSAAMLDRTALVRRGERLQWATIGWNSAEFVIAVVAGLLAGSVALLGFGFDSAIEVASSVAAVWRLRRDADECAREAAERRTLRVIGVCFLLLATWVTWDAVASLVRREAPAESLTGIVLAAMSMLVMPVLVRMKRRVASALGSGALEAESRQTAICAYLSAILLAGLGLNAWLGWWWADPVAGLVMVPLIAKEGLEAVRGETCCAD